mmetsp:Transcript_21515/g.52344  ORF Transcript_21515/g.52344 Transcript_21515/m.52344 type:complete len:334 (+) Transcript_21515:206-1207(+)
MRANSWITTCTPPTPTTSPLSHDPTPRCAVLVRGVAQTGERALTHSGVLALHTPTHTPDEKQEILNSQNDAVMKRKSPPARVRQSGDKRLPRTIWVLWWSFRLHYAGPTTQRDFPSPQPCALQCSGLVLHHATATLAGLLAVLLVDVLVLANIPRHRREVLRANPAATADDGGSTVNPPASVPREVDWPQILSNRDEAVLTAETPVGGHRRKAIRHSSDRLVGQSCELRQGLLNRLRHAAVEQESRHVEVLQHAESLTYCLTTAETLGQVISKCPRNPNRFIKLQSCLCRSIRFLSRRHSLTQDHIHMLCQHPCKVFIHLLHRVHFTHEVRPI